MLAAPWIYGSQSLASSFSFQYLLFLKSSRSIFFLPLSLPSSVLQWHHEQGNFFLEYIQFNCFSLQDCRILFRSILLSPIHSRTSLVTFSDHFISSILLQHHISKFSKYSTSILYVYVSTFSTDKDFCEEEMSYFQYAHNLSGDLFAVYRVILVIIPIFKKWIHELNIIMIPYSSLAFLKRSNDTDLKLSKFS